LTSATSVDRTVRAMTPDDSYFFEVRDQLIQDFRKHMRIAATLREFCLDWSDEFRDIARNIAREIAAFDISKERALFEDAEMYEGPVLSGWR